MGSNFNQPQPTESTNAFGRYVSDMIGDLMMEGLFEFICSGIRLIICFVAHIFG